MEKEGQIPFLDVNIIHRGGKLESTWYTKPTDTGLVLNYHALAPEKYKRAVVEGLVHRTFRSCSNENHYQESLRKAKGYLYRNQYPARFYEAIIEKTLVKLKTMDKNTIEGTLVSSHKEVGTRKHLASIQYRGVPTAAFDKEIRRSTSSCDHYA